MNIVRDPVYQQLTQALRRLIASGGFTEGQRFLTERQVSERYRVSRVTANKAHGCLVAEGVLEYRKGVGTFVKRGLLDNDLRTLVSFTDKARAAGKKPTTRVLHFEQLKAADIASDIAENLRLEKDDDVYLVDRLRLADGVPVILERRHIVARHCPHLRSADLAGSLYALWTDRYQLTIGGADQTIRAVSLTTSEARRLKARRGSPALVVLSTGFCTDGEPLWCERTLYRSDAYEFHMRLGLCSPRQAYGRLLNSRN